MFTVIFAILGLLVGSFVNAVVWRIHERITNKHDKKPKNDRSLNVWRGRSMCPECRHPLAAIDLVPVISWLALRGKCRYCGKPIAVQYPLVELATAVLFGLLYWVMRPNNVGGWIELGFWLYFLTVLIILAVYDWRWYILPDVVLLPAIIVGMIRLGVIGASGQPLKAVTSPLLAALVVGGSFYAVAALSDGRWMGGGDIKLAFLMGLLLGGTKTALAMLIAFNSAAVVGLGLIALKLKGRRDHIPFGPFLVVGTMVGTLFGPAIVGWYLRMVGL